MQGKLQQIIDQLAFLHLEVVLVLGAIALLILGLFAHKSVISRIGFAAVLLVGLIFNQQFRETQFVLTESLALGPLETFVKYIVVGFAIWIVFYANAREHSPEFYFLILSIVIGAVFMTSANHLLVVYISIELTSFSSYAITNFNFKKRSFEAGMKYLLFGGVSSAVMLYGISIIYGFTGSMHLSDIYISESQPFLAFGLLAFMGGLFFKISLFPFHIWTPAAYQEAPTDAVAVFSVVPKIAGLVILHRLLMSLELESISWVKPVLVFVGVGTILVGTLGALRQTNIKRLMAYGAIAHSGLLLGALLVGGDLGFTTFAWYTFAYALMNLSLFYFVSIYEQRGVLEVQGFRNLDRSHTFPVALFLMVMIALIGLPPTVGFTAKFYLFSALWTEYQMFSDPLLLTFLIVGILSVVFSLFYYLKIPYNYFIENKPTDQPVPIDNFAKFFATILTILLLWFFFSPEILNKIALNFDGVPW